MNKVVCCKRKVKKCAARLLTRAAWALFRIVNILRRKPDEWKTKPNQPLWSQRNTKQIDKKNFSKRLESFLALLSSEKPSKFSIFLVPKQTRGFHEGRSRTLRKLLRQRPKSFLGFSREFVNEGHKNFCFSGYMGTWLIRTFIIFQIAILFEVQLRGDER